LKNLNPRRLQGPGPLALLGLISTSLLVLFSNQVHAHHLTVQLNLQPSPSLGLLTGLLHPLIDPDHLLFLLALSLVGLRQPLPWLVALLAVATAGSMVGLCLQDSPDWLATISFTLVIEALVLLKWLPRAFLLPAFALHGCLLSSSVVGWSNVSISAFIIGLMFSQAGMLFISLTLLSRLSANLAEWVKQLLAIGLLACGLVWTYASLVT